MQGESWTGILQMIPAEQHHKLVMITHNNTEIHLQRVLHLDRDFIVVRGRLAASTDAGRVFFLPFDQVHYLAFRNPMKEDEILALLGKPVATNPEPAAALVTQETASEGTQQETQVAEPATPTMAPAGQPGSAPTKAALLERLRRSRGQ